jgi:hypothetical protein
MQMVGRRDSESAAVSAPDMGAPPRRRAAATGPARLTTSLSRRLDNQIARAFQHTYGAQTGLQALVQQGTREMLAAGGTPDLIRDAFRSCVSNHVATASGDDGSAVTSASESATLTDLMLSWVDEAFGSASSGKTGG